MQTVEEWRDVPGYEGYYRVSSLGNVISIRTGKILKPELIRGKGKTKTRLRLKLYLGTKSTKILIHRIVALAFIPLVPGKEQINHIDGNPLNNNRANLEWCNAYENINHGRKLGLFANQIRGELVPLSKLTNDSVIIIRSRYHELGKHKLASMFNVQERAIRDVFYRRTWKHV